MCGLFVTSKANMLQHCKVDPVSKIDATFESSLNLCDLVLGRLKFYISSFLFCRNCYDTKRTNFINKT